MGGERAVAVAAAAAAAVVVVRRPDQVVIQLSAAKQSNRIHLVPQRLRQAITNYLRSSSSDQIHNNNNEPLPPQISGDDDDDPADQDNKRRRSNNNNGRMIRRKREILMRLARNFNEIKGNNFQLSAAAAAAASSSSSSSHQLIDSSSSYFNNNNNNNSRAQRWKLDTKFGDSGLHYDDDQTAVYVAARMPSVYSACHRVLQEVCRRLVGFSPKRVLDFGSGSGAALWAVREVWPQDVEQVNTVEPSKAMLRASVNLLQHEQGLPIIQSYESIQSLNKKLKKSERQHDLVIASYVLGEIPSLKDRTTIVRQLWALTSDVLV